MRHDFHPLNPGLSALILLGASLMGGCSCLFQDGGTDVQSMVAVGRTREEVRKGLGDPVRQFQYGPDIPAGVAVNGARSRLEQSQLGTLISSWEEYEFHGWARNPTEWQGYGMAEALTLFLAEPFLLPSEIRFADDQKKRTHRYRLWFDLQGKVIAENELRPRTNEVHQMIENNGSAGTQRIVEFRDRPPAPDEDPAWIDDFEH